MKRILILTGLVLGVVRTAAGSDLLQVYDDALRFDPQIHAADATRMANREAAPQALAQLLPQLSATASWSRAYSNFSTQQPYPTTDGSVVNVPLSTSGYTNQRGYNLQLQQSLFSWANIAGMKKAHKQVAQAEADYHAAQEDLIQRVATAYFNVLSAQDTVDADQAALDAYVQQLEQANTRYDVGLIPITDVKEAQAAHDTGAAALIDAKRQLASMQQALREITSQDYPVLSKPGDDMALHAPMPADQSAWVNASMDQNLSLISSRIAADIARDQVEISRSGHFPTISLTAQRQMTHQDVSDRQDFFGVESPSIYPVDQTSTQYGLQVTVPIFSGGATQSQVRQSQYQWIAARDKVQQTSRQTEHLARDSYTNIISEIARVNALKQSLVSAQVALQATQAGYDVGTRTEFEVLQARQNLVSAQTSYAQSRYTYLLDIIALRLAAGTLDRGTLSEINGLLTATTPPAPAGAQ